MNQSTSAPAYIVRPLNLWPESLSNLTHGVYGSNEEGVRAYALCYSEVDAQKVANALNHEAIENPLGLGATGKPNPDTFHSSDRGELKVAAFIVKGQLVLDFGEQLSKVAMTRDEAWALAEALVKLVKRSAPAPETDSHSHFRP